MIGREIHEILRWTLIGLKWSYTRHAFHFWDFIFIFLFFWVWDFVQTFSEFWLFSPTSPFDAFTTRHGDQWACSQGLSVVCFISEVSWSVIWSRSFIWELKRSRTSAEMECGWRLVWIFHTKPWYETVFLSSLTHKHTNTNMWYSSWEWNWSDC